MGAVTPRRGRKRRPQATSAGCGAHRMGCLLFGLALASALLAQSPPKEKLLIIGEEKGYRHEAVSHAMATIERLGRQTGAWDTLSVPIPSR